MAKLVPAFEIDPQLLSAVENYADLTNTAVKECIDEALEDWLLTTASARIECRFPPPCSSPRLELVRSSFPVAGEQL